MNKNKKRQADKEIAAIAALKDSDIDTSDIPEVLDWSQAIVGRFFSGSRSDQHPAVKEDAKPQVLPGQLEQVGTFAGTYEANVSCVDKMNPQELIAECLLGEYEAGNEFVRRWHEVITASVLRAAAQYGRVSSDLVQDLTQEVFLKLTSNGYKLLKDFQETHESEFSGFLRVVSANVVCNYFGATYASTHGGKVNIDVESEISQVVNRSEAMERKVLFEELDRLLTTFASPKEQTVFWLRYRQGLTSREIAALPTIGLSVKGVESLLSHLMRQLKEKLALP